MDCEQRNPPPSKWAAVHKLQGAFTKEETTCLLLLYRAKASWDKIRKDVPGMGTGMSYYLQAWLSVVEGDLEPCDVPPWPGRQMVIRHAIATQPRDPPPQIRAPSPAALLGQAADSTGDASAAQSHRSQSPAPRSPQQSHVGPVYTKVDNATVVEIADFTLEGISQIVSYAQDVRFVSDERYKAIVEKEDTEYEAINTQMDVLLEEIAELGGVRI